MQAVTHFNNPKVLAEVNQSRSTSFSSLLTDERHIGIRRYRGGHGRSDDVSTRGQVNFFSTRLLSSGIHSDDNLKGGKMAGRGW